MSIAVGFGAAQQWAQTHFGAVQLGDVRRSRRVVQLAAGWARQPGASIPRLSGGQAYASKVAYHVLSHTQTTPEALQGAHQQQVRELIQRPGTYWGSCCNGADLHAKPDYRKWWPKNRPTKTDYKE